VTTQRPRPDIVCLQELKASQDKFPEGVVCDAGYGAIWHGQKSWNGVGILAEGVDPIETRRGLPGDAADTHSRFIEAAVNGPLVGRLYLPNGNPAPGPKFDFKLRWFDRLAAHAKRFSPAVRPLRSVAVKPNHGADIEELPWRCQIIQTAT
jgi:exodeoxyribonuclease-3